jgi:diaminopimelate epimerase
MKYQIYSGAGNDFVMFDNRDGIVPFEQQSEFTREICSEKFQKLDGVIFLERPTSQAAAIRMNYYNRDGSYGAMCGNGARCIARFAIDNGILKEKSFGIEAVEKIYQAEILDGDKVRIHFPPPAKRQTGMSVLLNGKRLRVHWMQVGSEHVVLFIHDKENQAVLKAASLDEVNVDEWGSKLRYHDQFAPKGANVNFVDISDKGLIVRTYERGVERETLACGTGIISTALIANLLYNITPPVRVLSRSGEELTVDFLRSNGNFRNVSLEGSARKIAEGEI